MSAGRAARARVLAGELVITFGVVVLLFCVYQLIWTNVEATAATDATSADLRAAWSASNTQRAPERLPAGQPLVSPTPTPQPTPEAPPPPPPPPPVPKGAFAFIHIPRLGEGWYRPVVQGVRDSDLAKGLGHYKTTQMPGEKGNFAVAGHRATHGEPFRDLDQLRKGDLIYVETQKRWYTYKMTATEIVKPSDSDVILPVPRQPGVAPDKAVITLTTCHPRWASTQRLIWHGVLIKSQPKSDGPPAGIAPAPGG